MSLDILVYAITKNEEHNVDEFMQNVGKDIPVYILDTGSTDATIDAFYVHPNVFVYEHEFETFRFDAARNLLLSYVRAKPSTYCLYLDLDERLEPDWYDKLVAHLTLFTEENGEPDAIYMKWYQEDVDNTFSNLRIHKRGYYEWKYPVHEVLVPSVMGKVLKYNEPFITAHLDLFVVHKPQDKERNYLPLLDIALKEDPNDLRTLHYYARELMFLGYYEAAIEYFDRYLLNNPTWAAEIAQIHAYKAQCSKQLEKWWDVEIDYLKSIAAFPKTRESYLALAEYYESCLEYGSAYGMVQTALRITIPPVGESMYLAYSAWEERPYVLAARLATNLGLLNKAAEYALEGLRINKTPELMVLYVQATGKVPEEYKQDIISANLSE